MPEIKDYAIGTLCLAVLISVGFAVQPDDTHVCRALEITKTCDHLSSSGRTCYPFATSRMGSKLCPEPWEEISKEAPGRPVSSGSGARQEICPVDGPCRPK